MPEHNLEELVRANEKDMQRIRETFFPLIVNGCISGYNIYSELWDYSKKRFNLNYLHGHSSHILRLADMLKQELGRDLEIAQTLVDRHSTYRTRPNWDTQLGMAYFDGRGNRLSLQEANAAAERGTNVKIIGEVMQYDWLIPTNSIEELKRIFDLIKKFSNKYQIDEHGRIIRDTNGKEKLNIYAIPASWEVPFISVCPNANRRVSLPGFKPAKEVIFPETIGSCPIAISTTCTEDTLKQLNKDKILRVTEKYIFGQAYDFICLRKEI